jgi:hypothetical protein
MSSGYDATEAPVTMPSITDDPRRELPPVMYAHLAGRLEQGGMRRFVALGDTLDRDSELARGWSVYVGCLVRRATRGLDDPRAIKAAVDKLLSSR